MERGQKWLGLPIITCGALVMRHLWPWWYHTPALTILSVAIVLVNLLCVIPICLCWRESRTIALVLLAVFTIFLYPSIFGAWRDLTYRTPLNVYLKDLHHPDPQVRVEAIRGLLLPHKPSRQYKRPFKQIYALRNDPDGEVRYEVMHYLGRRSSLYLSGSLKGMEDWLISSLSDPHRGVRGLAAENLGRLRVKRAVRPLIENLKDPDYYVRGSAADALGKLGDRSAIPALRKLLRDRNHYVRGSAADALGKLGEKSAIPILKKLLRDRNHYVRGSAADALGKLGDKSAIPALRNLLDDQVDYVRRIAKRAIEEISAREKD